jgi:hypothetical protein
MSRTRTPEARATFRDRRAAERERQSSRRAARAAKYGQTGSIRVIY